MDEPVIQVIPVSIKERVFVATENALCWQFEKRGIRCK